MATTVTGTEQIRRKETALGTISPPPPFPPGNGSRGGGGNGENGGARQLIDQRYRIGMWVGLAAIQMMFTALTSAYIVRAGSNAKDWQPIVMPRLLWLSTALILASSVTIEIARKNLKRGATTAYNRWLAVTAILGLGFLATQLLAWRQLVAQGVYLSSNPHSSFFYLLTGAHGLHLLGGIFALNYLLLRAWRKRSHESAIVTEMKRQAIAGSVALYWHFMDVLWIYLFLLLFLWR